MLVARVFTVMMSFRLVVVCRFSWSYPFSQFPFSRHIDKKKWQACMAQNVGF